MGSPITKTNFSLPDIKALTNYLVLEEFHANSLFRAVCPNEYLELYETLEKFTISKQEVVAQGGGKSPIAKKFDSFLLERGWQEKQFEVKISVDNVIKVSPTHSVDYFKNEVGIELEWNNKDTFFDRDLNNFRLLHSAKALTVGVIVTRCWELQEIFKSLKIGNKYGKSTTHIEKLMPKIQGGAAGTCPLLIIGITKNCFSDI